MTLATSGWEPAERCLIEDRIGEFFRDGIHRAARYGPEFERLWELTSVPAAGGKLVRPLLLINLHHALGQGRTGDRMGVVSDLAVALELLHYAFLLHDDVIDGDVLRRGSANLIGALLNGADATEGSRILHWARSGAILMGDLLLSASHQIFARAELPADQRLRLLDLLEHTVTESVAGELADVGLADRTILPDLPKIIAMTRRKTATYTFELPMRMAAVLNSAPSGVEDRLGAIGRHLGLGFQLQDDLLCAFGDPELHGKDVFSDLREGKHTAIIAFARKTDAWKEIEPILGRRDLTESEARRASRLLVECGARAFVEAMIDDELRSARALASGGHRALPEGARHTLMRLIMALEDRRS